MAATRPRLLNAHVIYANWLRKGWKSCCCSRREKLGWLVNSAAAVIFTIILIIVLTKYHYSWQYYNYGPY